MAGLARRLAPVIVCISLGVALAGCADTPSEKYPIKDALGKPVSTLSSRIGPTLTVAALDVSRSFGGTPEYKGGTAQKAEFVVVSICSDSANLGDAESMQIAVAKRNLLTDTDVEKAESGGYQNLLQCDKGQGFKA